MKNHINVGKQCEKEKIIETKIRENRAEPYEQENNDEKAKQILGEKCAKNAQRMREKRARQTDEEKCKKWAKNAQ